MSFNIITDELLGILSRIGFYILLFVGIYVWGYIASGIHEIAHVIVAYVLGFSPYRMEIGHGERVLSHFNIRHLEIVIHDNPYGGLTSWRDVPRNGIHWKGALLTSAGLIADAVLLFLLILFIIVSTVIAEDFEGFWSFPKVGIILLIYHLFIIIWSLFPRDITYNGKKIPNDTKQFFQYLTGKYIREIERAINAFRTAIVRYDKTFEQAEPWFLRADSVTIAQYVDATNDWQEKRYDAAITKYKSVLKSGFLSNGEKAQLLDTMACLPIYGEKQYMNDALIWSEEAFHLVPQAKTLQGTYGSLLIENGQVEQGIQVLKPLTMDGNDDIDRAISSCYLAKAYDTLGDFEQARFWLNKGKSIDASGGVCERIEGELTSACNVPGTAGVS